MSETSTAPTPPLAWSTELQLPMLKRMLLGKSKFNKACYVDREHERGMLSKSKLNIFKAVDHLHVAASCVAATPPSGGVAASV